jgi:hypothetical protein
MKIENMKHSNMIWRFFAAISYFETRQRYNAWCNANTIHLSAVYCKPIICIIFEKILIKH